MQVAIHQEIGDNFIMSNHVTVTAPLGIDDLQKYFSDDSINFIIDYENSELQGEKLLVYLSNLELPCDIKTEGKDLENLAKIYLQFPQILNIKVLEEFILEVLLVRKNLSLECLGCYQDFINDNEEVIDIWIKKLDSLTLYNMYIIQDDEMKDWVLSYKEDDTDDIKGINFVSLLKHEDFYYYYNGLDEKNLTYYSKYFNEYMFNGKSLFDYWSYKKNPLFLLTWGVGAGEV
jgi:hypothetical protein|tara:strand:- start:6553 stop:7248 length:696 start_codon:yes stop_codon:yes gene_type:complete